MIGTRISATLWVAGVQYWIQEPGQQPQELARRLYVVTADPSGADVHDVARMVVSTGLGKAKLVRFVLVSAERQAEVSGLASCQDDVGRGSLGVAMAHVHRLSFELARAERKIAELERAVGAGIASEVLEAVSDGG